MILSERNIDTLVMLRTACQRAHINNYSCHDFRHTYISNLIRSGVPLSVVEYVSGDTQETIFKHYSHMFEGDEVLVLDALEKLKDGYLEDLREQYGFHQAVFSVENVDVKKGGFLKPSSAMQDVRTGMS